MIGHISSNRELKCQGVIRKVLPNSIVNYEPQFNEEITQMIMQSRAIAATDASVKEGELGGAWIIMSTQGREVLSNKLYHKEWDENSSKAAKAIVLLELVTVITKKSINIRSGKIIIALDCSEVNKLIIKKLHKATALVCDGGSEIAAIRQAIEASTIQIEFKLQNGHPKKVPMFRQNLLQWIVCECDKRANEERETIERRNNVTNI